MYFFQKHKLKNVKLLAMDFDGVHTDGYVYVDQDGREMVRCSRRDSLGLSMLKELGVKLVVISKETNSVVLARCNKLGIECYDGVANATGKKDILEFLLKRDGLSTRELMYIGDDINDIRAIEYAGIGVTVFDAVASVKHIADIVLTSNGGEHALRELCDMLINAKSIDKKSK